MKFRLLVVPMIGLALTSPSLHAQMTAAAAPGAANEYSVEGQFSSYKYEEPALMDLEGKKGGAAARVTRRGEKEVFVAGEARLAYGKVDYDSVSTGSYSGAPDYLYEFRGLFGKRFQRGNLKLSPYFGFGWRHLINDAAGQTTTTGHTGYERISDYYYLPLGIDLQHSFGGANYLEVNAEYDLLLRGTQKSLGYLGDDLKNTQNRGYGLRASALFGFGPWAVGPFVNSWKIAKSNVVACNGGFSICWEPANETLEAGLRLRYTFQ